MSSRSSWIGDEYEDEDENENENEEEEEIPLSEEELVELAEQERREAERQRLMEEYQKYYTQIYRVNPNLPERARAFREREIARAGGPKAIQSQRLAEFLSRHPPITREQRMLSRGQRLVRRYLSRDCENPPRDTIYERVRLRVRDINGNTHYLCYNVIDLFTYLVTQYSSPSDWKDPTYQRFYTPNQVDLIRHRYQQISSCEVNVNILDTLTVGRSSNQYAVVPLNFYPRIADHPYHALRLFHDGNILKYGHAYAVVNNYHQNPTILLPDAILNKLQLSSGQKVLIEACFGIRRIEGLRLHPLTESWYQLKYSDVDEIVEQLTLTVQNLPILALSDVIILDYKDNSYRLEVVDIRSQNRRISVGIPKMTEVKVEIVR